MNAGIIPACLIVSLATLPLKVLAGDLSYDYVQTSYRSSINANIDVSGFSLEGARLINRSAYVFGEYSRMGARLYETGPRFDAGRHQLGLGYRLQLLSNTDFNVRGSWVGREELLSADGMIPVTYNAHGYGLAVGIRHLFTRHFELGVTARHIGYKRSSGTDLAVNALIHLSQGISINSSYAGSASSGEWDIGLRYNF